MGVVRFEFLVLGFHKVLIASAPFARPEGLERWLGRSPKLQLAPKRSMFSYVILFGLAVRRRSVVELLN